MTEAGIHHVSQMAVVALIPSSALALWWAATHGEDLGVLAVLVWILALWWSATRQARNSHRRIRSSIHFGGAAPGPLRRGGRIGRLLGLELDVDPEHS